MQQLLLLILKLNSVVCWLLLSVRVPLFAHLFSVRVLHLLLSHVLLDHFSGDLVAVFIVELLLSLLSVVLLLLHFRAFVLYAL